MFTLLVICVFSNHVVNVRHVAVAAAVVIPYKLIIHNAVKMVGIHCVTQQRNHQLVTQTISKIIVNKTIFAEDSLASCLCRGNAV